jgi:hypothetical protein
LRDWLLTLVACALGVCACGKDTPAPARAPLDPAEPVERSPQQIADGSDAAAPPTEPGAAAPRTYPDLAAALMATIPGDARVIGFGELHARRDRPAAPSTLAAFTRALPAIAGRLSDLVIETWRIDPRCGQPAVQATARIEASVERPAATRSEIGQLIDAARAARIEPHAMTLGCADYKAVAPDGGEVDTQAMLSLTTRELRRIVTSAVAHRDGEPGHRPWIAVYGGALHNDRFPAAGVAEWSYAADADRATGGHFVEIDVVVPELAADRPSARREPWFSLVSAPRDPARPVVVWTRGERSFVVLLPPAPPTAPPAGAPR